MQMQSNRPSLLFVPILLTAILLPCLKVASAQNAEIDKRIKENIKKLQSDNIKVIIEGRTGLVKDYDHLVTKNQGSEYAAKVGKYIKPALKTQKLRQKQLNLAIVLPKIPEAVLQDVFEMMVADENPAIQYLGWQAYRQTWPKILAKRNPAGMNLLLKSMNKAISLKTQNILILNRIFDIIPFSTSTNVSANVIATARTKMIDILEVNWNRLCLKIILDGDPAYTTLLTKATQGLEMLWDQAEKNDLAAKNNNDTTRILKMVALVTHCTAKRYDHEITLDNKGSAMTTAGGTLLVQIESFLSISLRVEPRYFEKALKSKTPGTDVSLASLNWLDELENRKAITKAERKALPKIPVGVKETVNP